VHATIEEIICPLSHHTSNTFKYIYYYSAEDANEYPAANSRVHPKARFQFSPRTKAALAPRGREPVPNPPANNEKQQLQQGLSLSKQYKNI
jgi:hypothetical protein